MQSMSYARPARDPYRPPGLPSERKREGGREGAVHTPPKKGGGDDAYTPRKNSMGETDRLTRNAFLKLV